MVVWKIDQKEFDQFSNSTLKAKATKVLQALYDRVNGDTTKLVDLKEIAKELGYTEE